MPTVAPSNFASPSSQTAPIAVDTAITWDRACLNCGTALSGPFCAECGQRAVPPNPTLRELAGHAFEELSGWDGRLATTVRALLFHPGRLTIEFLEGRRVRYLSPLRLYLLASLVYFALAAATPDSSSNKVNVGRVGNAAVSVSTPSANPDPDLDVQSIDPKELEAKIEKLPAILQPVVRRGIADQAGFRRDMFNSLPKALFILLPVFAGILKVFYPKRGYAEHLYYALHVHAFGFVAMILSLLSEPLHVVILQQIVATVILIGVPIYWHRALRRVYGGSLGATLLKESGIGVLYGFATIPVLIGLAMWVARG